MCKSCAFENFEEAEAHESYVPLTSSIIVLSNRCNHKILWLAYRESRQKCVSRWRGAATSFCGRKFCNLIKLSTLSFPKFLFVTIVFGEAVTLFF